MQNIFSTFMKTITIILLSLTIVLSITGCGSGASGASKISASHNKGTLSISVQWPQRTASSGRLIPTQTNCIKVVFGTNGAYPPVLIQRPGVSANPALAISTPTTSVKITDLPIGAQVVQATAYPNADGSGTPQAMGVANVTVLSGKTVPLSLAMGTTIKSIKVSVKGRYATAHLAGRDVQPPLDIGNGTAVDLIVTALDASGQVVITDPTRWKWVDSTPGVAALAPSQNTAVVTGKSLGSATLTVTETESGVSGQAPLKVGATGAWNQQWADQRNSNCSTGPGAMGTVSAKVDLTSYPASGMLERSAGLVDFTNVGDGYSLYQLSGASLSKLFTPSTTIYAMALGSDGTFYNAVSSDQNNGALQALSQTGAIKWQSATTFYNSIGLTFTTDGLLYNTLVDSSGKSGSLVSADAATGAIHWTQQYPGLSPSGKPAVGDGGVVYSLFVKPDLSGGAMALDPKTGEIIWSASVPGVLYNQQVSIAPSGLVIVTNKSYIYALDPASGATVWSVKSYISNENCNTIVTPNGTVIATDGADLGLQGIDTATGAVLWHISGALRGTGIPLAGASDGTIYALSLDSVTTNLYSIQALDEKSGSVKWAYQLQPGGGSSSLNLVGSDGAVYLNDYAGTFGGSDYHPIITILK